MRQTYYAYGATRRGKLFGMQNSYSLNDLVSFYASSGSCYDNAPFM